DEKREHGPIHVSALDAKARLGACTTTSGLSWKIPGRVGDSPLIGCGLYTDNDIGSAGSTGRGEAAILSNGSHLVVEHMRRGLAPQAACLEVLRRVVHYTRIRRLRDDRGRPDFQLKFYALNKKGEYGSASMYPSSFVVCTDEGDRRLDAAALYPSR
ncbi:MAG: isoaspartyl peptidase/L-asparaginase, partial [Planctomycetota bacterium]